MPPKRKATAIVKKDDPEEPIVEEKPKKSRATAVKKEGRVWELLIKSLLRVTSVRSASY